MNAEDRAVGCLWGCLIGDALGAAVEGERRSQLPKEGVWKYIPAQHMGIERLGPRYVHLPYLSYVSLLYFVVAVCTPMMV